MNLSKHSGDAILETLQCHIDTASSIEDLDRLLQITPLQKIKLCLKNHILHLHNEINVSSNTNNKVYNNAQCSSQYNELRKLAISISSITDILPHDIIKYVLSFITTRHFSDNKETNKYYKFLPVLSKQFQSIMNDAYFYDSKYPLYIHDNSIKKVRKSKKPETETYDPAAIHIYADHNSAKLEIMHVKSMKFKSTKTIKRIPSLSPVKVFQSSLPWKTRHKIIIINKENTNSWLKGNPNSNILNVLNEVKNDPKYGEIAGSIFPSRINAYPTFKNIVCLSVKDLWIELRPRFMSSGPTIGGVGCIASSNLKWLNKKRFPSLQILSIVFECLAPTPEINRSINSLDLLALELTAKTLRKWKLSSNLEFFSLTCDNIDKLDLSECNKLIGLQLHSSISFSQIIWSKTHSLTLINVKTKHWIFANDGKIQCKVKYWVNASKQKTIPSRILIGDSFHIKEKETQNLSKKYIRTNWMNFDKIIEYVNGSNITHQSGWGTIYKQCFRIGVAAFIQRMGQQSCWH